MEGVNRQLVIEIIDQEDAKTGEWLRSASPILKIEAPGHKKADLSVGFPRVLFNDKEFNHYPFLMIDPSFYSLRIVKSLQKPASKLDLSLFLARLQTLVQSL
ncbi:MAG: hypothetical protein NHB32_01560 [Fischerella sp. CENA71]|nr:hypothetical protein [Fischerella sp. CENA71]